MMLYCSSLLKAILNCSLVGFLVIKPKICIFWITSYVVVITLLPRVVIGADSSYVIIKANKIYVEKLANIKLRAKLVLKFKTTSEGVAYLINTKEDVARYGLPIFDISRGMVNIMSGIEGINVRSNFTETETGEVYCEFRSNGVNVNKVATMFGGGGHLQASGCTLPNKKQIKSVIRELNKATKGEE